MKNDRMEMDFLMDRDNFYVDFHLNMYLIEENHLLLLNFDYEDNWMLNKKDRKVYLIDRKRFLLMSMSFVVIEMFDHLK